MNDESEAGANEVDNGESGGCHDTVEKGREEPDVVAAVSTKQGKKRRKRKKKTGKPVTEAETEEDVDKLIEELQLETVSRLPEIERGGFGRNGMGWSLRLEVLCRLGKLLRILNL